MCRGRMSAAVCEWRGSSYTERFSAGRFLRIDVLRVNNPLVERFGSSSGPTSAQEQSTRLVRTDQPLSVASSLHCRGPLSYRTSPKGATPLRCIASALQRPHRIRTLIRRRSAPLRHRLCTAEVRYDVDLKRRRNRSLLHRLCTAEVP
jgi:hypothetical protein